MAVLAIAAAFAVGAAWFVGPALAGLVVQGALAGAGFEGRGTSVTVAADPPLEVLAGHADRLTIRASDAAFREFRATRLDVTLTDVHLLERSFGTIDGRLDGVGVRQDDRTIPIRHVDLHGPAAATGAVATIAGADVEALATAALDDALGLPITTAELVAPDLLRLSIAGQVADARFVVDRDGSLALELPLSGKPRVLLVDEDPFGFASVTVVDDDLVLTGTFDATTLLGR